MKRFAHKSYILWFFCTLWLFGCGGGSVDGESDGSKEDDGTDIGGGGDMEGGTDKNTDGDTAAVNDTGDEMDTGGDKNTDPDTGTHADADTNPDTESADEDDAASDGDSAMGDDTGGDDDPNTDAEADTDTARDGSVGTDTPCPYTCVTQYLCMSDNGEAMDEYTCEDDGVCCKLLDDADTADTSSDTTGDTGDDTSTASESEAFATILAVEAAGQGGAYTFAVTIESSDIDCTAYVDWWEILSSDSELIYRRILSHPHTHDLTCNPYTRESQGAVNVAADDFLYIRAHFHPDGYISNFMQGTVEDGFEAAPAMADDFAVDLEDDNPQPTGCTPEENIGTMTCDY